MEALFWLSWGDRKAPGRAAQESLVNKWLGVGVGGLRGLQPAGDAGWGETPPRACGGIWKDAGLTGQGGWGAGNGRSRDIGCPLQARAGVRWLP